MNDVTIQDAINAFSLLSEHVNENGFLHECYNLGICALKTVQDGDYQLKNDTIPKEILEEIVNYNCSGLDCNLCKYYHQKCCLFEPAKGLLMYDEFKKEIETWMKEHSNY